MSNTDFGYGQMRPEDGASDYNRMDFFIRQQLARVRTVMPCQVMAVTGGGLGPPPTVDVQPLVNMLDGQGNSLPHGTVHGIPVIRIQNMFGSVIADPAVGDIGVMLVSDRDISGVVDAQGPANPGSLRRFDFSDAIYIGGILGTGVPSQYLTFNQSAAELVSNTNVQVTAPIINLNGQVIYSTRPFGQNILNFPGVDPTGVSDSTAGIQAAINLLDPGETIYFPVGIYQIGGNGNGLVLGSGSKNTPVSFGCYLQGAGSPPGINDGGWPQNAGTIFNWVGPSNGTAIEIQGPLQGWGLSNFLISGTATGGASTGCNGLRLFSAQYGEVRNVSIAGFKNCLVCTTYDGSSAADTPNTMHNLFDNLCLTTSFEASAVGLVLTGGTFSGANANISNTSFNQFNNLTIFTQQGHAQGGIVFQNADSNLLQNVHLFGASDGAGVTYDYTLSVLSGTGALFPCSNYISGIEPGGSNAGGISFQNSGSPGLAARCNYITGLYEANGAYVPFLDNLVHMENSSQFPPWGTTTGAGGTNYNIAFRQTMNLPSTPQDGQLYTFRANKRNTSTTPTLTLTDHGFDNAYGAITIVKGNNLPLVPGDIPGSGAECIVRYNSSLGVFVLMNPYGVQGNDAVYVNPTLGGGYQGLATDTTIMVSSASGAGTVFLPVAATWQGSGLLTISDWDRAAGTNNITIARSGSDTINNSTGSLVINTNGGAYTFANGGPAKPNSWTPVGHV